ncbi:MAG: hypothetical protein ACE5JN_03930 [Candidatus Methylomirabilia bacterium]
MPRGRSGAPWRDTGARKLSPSRAAPASPYLEPEIETAPRFPRRSAVECMRAGWARAVVDRKFPLSEAQHAVQYLTDRKNREKILLIPDGAA